jgi:hypothetical protein
MYGVEVSSDLMSVLPEIIRNLTGARLLIDETFSGVARFDDLSTRPKVKLSNGTVLYKVIDEDEESTR